MRHIDSKKGRKISIVSRLESASIAAMQIWRFYVFKITFEMLNDLINLQSLRQQGPRIHRSMFLPLNLRVQSQSM